MSKTNQKWMAALLGLLLAIGPKTLADSSSSDRKGGSNAASGMALAASAMQQIMCFKMMQEAQAKGDSTMMMMAMQMCAQAAASAANAAQNKEGSKKLTSTPLEKAEMAPLKEMKIDTQVKDDSFDPNQFKSDSKSTPDSGSTESVSFEAPKTDGKVGDVYQGKSIGEESAVPLSNQKPEGPEGSEITLNNSRSGGAQAGSPWSTSGGNSNSLQNAQAKASAAASADEEKRKAGKKAAGTSDGSGGAASAGESGDNSAFDDFLAKMMGGGANNSFSAAGLGGGMIDVALDLQRGDSRPLTIFEFASIQYQKAKQSGLGIKRGLASTPSR